MVLLIRDFLGTGHGVRLGAARKEHFDTATGLVKRWRNRSSADVGVFVGSSGKHVGSRIRIGQRITSDGIFSRLHVLRILLRGRIRSATPTAVRLKALVVSEGG